MNIIPLAKLCGECMNVQGGVGSLRRAVPMLVGLVLVLRTSGMDGLFQSNFANWQQLNNVPR